MMWTVIIWEGMPFLYSNFSCGKQDADLYALLSPYRSVPSGEYSWVSVLHIPKGNYLASSGYFGDPFLIPVKVEGEKVGVLRERIRRKVRVKEEEFDNWALFSITVSSTDPLDDVEATWSEGSDEIGSISLAIEHTRRVPPKRTYGLMKYDKPLVIKS
uniref:ubiquitinyl hydrolase 1 n=1 Tax=Rhodosorus marinus TaxID=101924 RepID=A0A7S3EI02_9RHOD|mmetsp:Transcript_37333/g.149013  ORF Transcript_37333/g.149013 Transcript_37333/m.149013 type:complete len:158 (+) Transcript_37333:3096-3569(+)